jgi:hypothetical protein
MVRRHKNVLCKCGSVFDVENRAPSRRRPPDVPQLGGKTTCEISFGLPCREALGVLRLALAFSAEGRPSPNSGYPKSGSKLSHSMRFAKFAHPDQLSAGLALCAQRLECCGLP